MNVEQLEQCVQELSDHDRMMFVTWLDEHRHELVVADEAQAAEVRHRLAEIDRDPSILEPFEESNFRQMTRDLTNARNQKTSAGPR